MPANNDAPDNTLPAAPKKPGAPQDAAAAFASIETEVNALAPEDMVAINIDVPSAVSVVLGALPGVLAMCDDVATQLPQFPLSYFENLETYALAAWYAHLTALPAPTGNEQVKELAEEAAALRATLLSDAEALARRGLVPIETVNEIRAGQGHIDTANDLVALAALFTMSWSLIAGKTAATLAEVERAAQLGPQLLAALGVRQHGRVTASEAAERRQRAFSLLVRAYDAVRRAVTYLRWNEGDADLIAPSLYKGRGGRPSSDAAAKAAPAPASPATPPAASPPAAPDASSGSSPA